MTVRRDAKVEHRQARTLGEALDMLEDRGRGLAAQPRRADLDLKLRTIAAADQVAARVQIAGPQRWRPDVRAGIDVHGDGRVQAWTGGARRAAIAPADGESPYDALRRRLQDEGGPVAP